MAKNAKEEINISYTVPENFIEGGRVFNGMFKTANFIEAVIIGGFFGWLGSLIPVHDLGARITIITSMVAPWFFVCIIGINDDTFVTYVRSAIRWGKNKKIIMFDSTPRPREAAPLDMMMAETPIRDQIIDKVEQIGERRKESVREYMESATIELAEDEELKRLKTPTQRQEEQMAKLVKKNKSQIKSIKEVEDLDSDDTLEIETIQAPDDTFAINIDDSLGGFDESDLF